MTSTDFTDLIEQARQAADALQLEIDAAIDRHGVLRRFIDGMLGNTTPTGWVVVERDPADQARNEQFTAVDAKPAAPLGSTSWALANAKPKAATAAPKADGKLASRTKAATSGRKTNTEHWAAVAAWIVAAKVDGRYSLPALAEAFDTTTSTASNWPGRCRQLGYDIDHAPVDTATGPASVQPVAPVDNGRRTFSPDDAADLLEAM